MNWIGRVSYSVRHFRAIGLHHGCFLDHGRAGRVPSVPKPLSVDRSQGLSWFVVPEKREYVGWHYTPFRTPR
jgi:hypothetical protein